MYFLWISVLVLLCIQQSAGALVDNLMKAQPSYIRTIKPNQNRSSSEYDTKAILHQIKYLGLQENVRVRRAGFAYRNTFEKMVERFYLLSPNTSYAGEYTWTGNAKSACEQILKDTGKSNDSLRFRLLKPLSFSLWKPCVTNIGTIWQVAFKEPSVIICGTSRSVPDASRGFGRTTKKASSIPKFVTMDIKLSQGARSVVASVFLVTVDSWAII